MVRLFHHTALRISDVALARDRVRDGQIAGIRAAHTNGKILGRPKRIFKRDEVVTLRDKQSLNWRAIAKELEKSRS